LTCNCGINRFALDDRQSERRIAFGKGGGLRSSLSRLWNSELIQTPEKYTLADGIEAVLVNLNGQVSGHRSIPLTPASAELIFGTVRETTRDFLNDPVLKGSSFAGVGPCLPANFGSVGKYLKAHESYMKLDGNSLKEAIQGQSDWDIFLENDGTAVALGEFLFGNHGVKTLFLLNIGYGLGGGADLNGPPYRGAHGNACLSGALFPYNAPRPKLQTSRLPSACPVAGRGRRTCPIRTTRADSRGSTVGLNARPVRWNLRRASLPACSTPS